MIKILFFIESLASGGAEKVLCNLVNNMDQNTFDITVQTLFPDENASQLKKNIHYKSVYRKKNKCFRMIQRFETELGLTYFLRMRDHYDIEVAYLECGSTKILAASTNQRAKKLAWVHSDLVHGYGDDAVDFARKTKKWYEKYDQVVCVSQQVRDSFVKLFGDEIRSTVVYNTVDSNEIIEKSKKKIPDHITKRKRTVLFVGRLSSPKNILRLLKAHRRILDDAIDHDLWIVGDGEKRGSIESFIEENHLCDTVKLFGFRENPYCFMREADLLVCSSDYEGFSTFITEGLILGKAIVTTDVSGMRELLGDSQYGIITEVSDDSFYEGLKDTLMYSDSELEKLSEIAFQRGKDFITSNLVMETEKLLKNQYDGGRDNG